MMLVFLFPPQAPVPDLNLPVVRSAQIELVRDAWDLRAEEAMLSEDGTGAASALQLGYCGFWRFGGATKSLGVYEAPYAASRFRRTLLLGSDVPEARSVLYPNGKVPTVPPGFRSNFLWGRIGAWPMAAQTAAKWIVRSTYPTGRQTNGIRQEDALLSLFGWQAPGQPNPGLFNSSQLHEHDSPYSTVVMLRLLHGTSDFAALSATTTQDSGGTILRCKSFRYRNGTVKAISAAAAWNPFRPLTLTTFRLPKSLNLYFGVAFDPEGGRICDYRQDSPDAFVSSGPTYERLSLPLGYSAFRFITFASGRLLATIDHYTRERVTDKERLFEWTGTAWNDCGPYAIAARSASGTLLMLKPTAGQDSGRRYLVWTRRRAK
jgi:hypothetical protein